MGSVVQLEIEINNWVVNKAKGYPKNRFTTSKVSHLAHTCQSAALPTN
jgi:hypothetical protein